MNDSIAKIMSLLMVFALLLSFSDTAYCARGYTIAAYYFPGWHVEEKNKYRPQGWTGWDQLKKASPKFPGHLQPKIPLWGYEDETSPAVMEKKIATASKYGVDAFIFDWYYNDSGPYLNGALDKGFLFAKNIDKVKFGVMWANHSVNGQPAKISEKTFDEITDMLVNKYFKHKSYWKIANKPYFSIYDIEIFVNTFGGFDGAAKAIDKLRHKTKKAGFDDIYLSIIEWKLNVYSPEKANQLLLVLSANCVDSYTWIHKTKLNTFPATSYDDVIANAKENWSKSKSLYLLPFNPNVTMGWDPSPRAEQDSNSEWKQGAYPFTPVIVGNTPAKFNFALKEAKRFLDKSGYSNKIVTINAWNEWTEGSYLEPDASNGYKYLEAIKNVFLSFPQNLWIRNKNTAP